MLVKKIVKILFLLFIFSTTGFSAEKTDVVVIKNVNDLLMKQEIFMKIADAMHTDVELVKIKKGPNPPFQCLQIGQARKLIKSVRTGSREVYRLVATVDGKKSQFFILIQGNKVTFSPSHSKQPERNQRNKAIVDALNTLTIEVLSTKDGAL